MPKFAITLVANTLYGEPYATHAMRHTWQQTGDTQTIQYDWKVGADWNHIRVGADRAGHSLVSGSEEEFITEHYWGYTRLGIGKTSQYEVTHPRWEVYAVRSHRIDVDFGALYGPQFSFLEHQAPHSVMLAEGSAIAVKVGKPLRFS